MIRQRVIFLDIDGILNTLQDIKNAAWVMNQVNVAILRSLVEETNAALVISSSWRYEVDWEKRIRRIFSQAEWDSPPIIDRTPALLGGRGKEIALWLETHSVKDFVIVDDDTFDILPEQREYLIHCDSTFGFTALNAQEIKKHWEG